MGQGPAEDHNGAVPLAKFRDGNAFVFCDLPKVPASGPVRVAPKVLQSTSKELARSMTYRFALFGLQRGGLAAGVNAGDDRTATLDGFLGDIGDQVASGEWRFLPGSGLGVDHDPAFSSGVDPRAEAAGVIASAVAARGTDLVGARVVLDHASVASNELLAALDDAGAAIVAVGTTYGSVHGDKLDANAVRALAEGNDAAEIGSVTTAPALEVDADVLFVGAKMGALDHINADAVAAPLVVPIDLLAFTTKAAVMLQRRGVTVLPDFLSLAGGSLVAEGSARDAAEAAAQVAEITTQVSAQTDQLPSVSAALRAEAFLATWHEPVFGRPFAP